MPPKYIELIVCVLIETFYNIVINISKSTDYLVIELGFRDLVAFIYYLLIKWFIDETADSHTYTTV